MKGGAHYFFFRYSTGGRPVVAVFFFFFCNNSFSCYRHIMLGDSIFWLNILGVNFITIPIYILKYTYVPVTGP